jgi:hypothetical protein
MPQWNPQSNPAILAAQDVYARAQKALRGLQEPAADDSWMEAVVKGFAGGAGEAALGMVGTDDPKQMVESAVLGSVSPAAMVNMPSKYVGKFGQNFKDYWSKRLDQTGHPEAAQLAVDFAKRHPRAAGNLQEFKTADLPIQTRGLYTPNIVWPPPAQGNMKMIEEFAEAGLPAPANNRITLNMQGMKDHNEELFRRLQPETAAKYTPEMRHQYLMNEAREMTEHEGLHLGQDYLKRLEIDPYDGGYVSRYAYGVDPNEVLARLGQDKFNGAKTPVVFGNALNEIVSGIYNYKTTRTTDDLAYDAFASLKEITRRIRKPMTAVQIEEAKRVIGDAVLNRPLYE